VSDPVGAPDPGNVPDLSISDHKFWLAKELAKHVKKAKHGQR